MVGGKPLQSPEKKGNGYASEVNDNGPRFGLSGYSMKRDGSIDSNMCRGMVLEAPESACDVGRFEHSSMQKPIISGADDVDSHVDNFMNCTLLSSKVYLLPAPFAKY